MNKRDEIKRIWSECFNDSKEYVDMYFDRIYRDEDAVTLESGNQIISSMLLQHYMMSFHDSIQPVAYIAGAATRRSHRGMGNMRKLLRSALKASYDRGDMLCALIPAHDWLYFYYDKSGFATVFYSDSQRYTADHSFPIEENQWHESDDLYSDEVFEAFSKLEHQLPCTILHNKRDFLNILDDLRMDGGKMVVVKDNDGEIKAMAFASMSDDLVIVRALLSDSSQAATAALHFLRKYFPGKAFKVIAHPSDNDGHRRLSSRGMARIINVHKTIEAIATADPKWKCTIRITDPIIEANNRYYYINDGKVTESIEPPCHRPDFDVDITTFTEIVFSSKKIGEILSFPTVRPIMALMLD